MASSESTRAVSVRPATAEDMSFVLGLIMELAVYEREEAQMKVCLPREAHPPDVSLLVLALQLGQVNTAQCLGDCEELVTPNRIRPLFGTRLILSSRRKAAHIPCVCLPLHHYPGR